MLALVVVSVLAFTWVLFAFYWVRGQLRARAVRRLLPTAVLFEVVMTPELADEVLMAEQTLGEPAPRIWPQSYLTGAATSDALWFFGVTAGFFNLTNHSVIHSWVPFIKLNSLEIK